MKVTSIYAGFALSLATIFSVAATDVSSTASTITPQKDWAIGLHASTLGVGPNITYKLNSYFKIGVTGSYFSYSRNDKETFRGRAGGAAISVPVDFKLTIRPFTVGGIVDFHPFEGSFYLRGGLFYNGNEARLSASLKNLNVTFNGVNYNFGAAGSAKGKFYFNPVSPYFGIGYGAEFDNITFTMDAGVLFQGKAKAKVTQLNGLAAGASTQDIKNAEIAYARKLNKHKVIQFYPVIAFGINYKF